VAAPDLPRAALARIAALAEREPGLEACGLVLLGPLGDCEVWPCRNASPDPARAFDLDPRDLLRALERADEASLAVAAVYHSHPGGGAALSRSDRAGALAGGLPSVPGAALLVVARREGGPPRILRYRWTGDGYSEGELVFGDGPGP
jgi:proteasome lid subunit RPN8/RPN11